MSNRDLARAGLIGIYLAALYLPLHEFFNNRGGTEILQGLSAQSVLQVLFPLLGLYAFTFVTFQVLVATNLWWLRKLWPNVINFHRFQGSFALLFALLHPFFILAGFGLGSYFSYEFVSSEQKPWLVPAYIAITILLLTVGTALLAWQGRNVPYWRKLHRLNYFVFPLIWLHSWFIGTDTRTDVLRAVWIIYLIVVCLSVGGKLFMIRQARLDRASSV